MKRQKLGRPKGTIRNLRVHQLMQEHSCSRVWAYQLLRREQREDRKRRTT